jgi:aryl-alcohol dehydrogenase-like predicted oxidoreductase
LMLTDDHAGQLRAVREAVLAGVIYFDSAAGYGAGKSESNLGRALKTAGVEAVVATKIRLVRTILKIRAGPPWHRSSGSWGGSGVTRWM